MNRRSACLGILIPWLLSTAMIAADSDLVPMNPDGTLRYVADSRGNRLPDFSFAGYEGGRVMIPTVAVVATLDPPAGDATALINDTIARLGNLPMDTNGFRGAILLRRGIYDVVGTIHINKGGIVLRGEGSGRNGTIIRDNNTRVEPTIAVGQGALGWARITDLTDGYVPVGVTRLHVQDTAGLRVGQTIRIVSDHTQKWVDDLGLTAVWTASSFTNNWKRTITAINAGVREITLDRGITAPIDKANGYASGTVNSCTDNLIAKVGFENIVFVSTYDRSKTFIERNTGKIWYIDENHANWAIQFNRVADAWLRRCQSFFYYQGLVNVWRMAERITIEDCATMDGTAPVRGESSAIRSGMAPPNNANRSRTPAFKIRSWAATAATARPANRAATARRTATGRSSSGPSRRLHAHSRRNRSRAWRSTA